MLGCLRTPWPDLTRLFLWFLNVGTSTLQTLIRVKHTYRLALLLSSNPNWLMINPLHCTFRLWKKSVSSSPCLQPTFWNSSKVLGRHSTETIPSDSARLKDEGCKWWCWHCMNHVPCTSCCTSETFSPSSRTVAGTTLNPHFKFKRKAATLRIKPTSRQGKRLGSFKVIRNQLNTCKWNYGPQMKCVKSVYHNHCFKKPEISHSY